MQYKLIFKTLTTRDINKDCPYIPTDEDYEFHLNTIIEDIQTIPGVLDVNLTDGTVLVTTEKMAQATFEKRLEPFLREHFCYLRLCLTNIQLLQE